MIKKEINITDTNLTSKIVKNFLNNKKLDRFYSYQNEIKNYEKLIHERLSFSDKKRSLLHEVVKDQYRNIKISSSVSESINNLQKPNTFTITTGHQLCLNTGPLYFIYKILQCIKITVELQKKYSDYIFVPVFWMATEDHDFDEISSFQTKNKRYEIQTDKKGSSTGKIKPLNISQLVNEFESDFKNKPFKNEILSLFKYAYNSKTNLADSTRILVHSLFKDYGLICIDADNHRLKSSFKEILADELDNFSCHKQVLDTNKKINDVLDKKVKVQVNPRKLNLFLFHNNKRFRLEFENNFYKVVGTDLTFTKEEIIKQLNNRAELFSPNVLMRPIYQEFILPNLAYVGGSAEISYWLQLKSLFDYHKISFPILVLRNSFLLLSSRDFDLVDKNKIIIDDLLLNKEVFINKTVQNNIENELSLDDQKNEIKEIFKSLMALTNKIDKNLDAFVKSSESKQLKIFDLIEKKIVKSQKRKMTEHVNSCSKIHEKVYPYGIFQERILNFSEYYSFTGKYLSKKIYDSITPFDNKLIVLEI